MLYGREICGFMMRTDELTLYGREMCWFTMRTDMEEVLKYVLWKVIQKWQMT